MPSTGCFLPG
jgi:hypothetical protein